MSRKTTSSHPAIPRIAHHPVSHITRAAPSPDGPPFSPQHATTTHSTARSHKLPIPGFAPRQRRKPSSPASDSPPSRTRPPPKPASFGHPFTKGCGVRGSAPPLTNTVPTRYQRPPATRTHHMEPPHGATSSWPQALRRASGGNPCSPASDSPPSRTRPPPDQQALVTLSRKGAGSGAEPRQSNAPLVHLPRKR